jgi:uncharacterized membrane protein
LIEINAVAPGREMPLAGGAAMSESVPVFVAPSPRVRLVDVDRPWIWLAKGWRDLMAAPNVSLAYGAIFVAISYALVVGLAVADLLYLLLPLLAGFGFLAPLLAVGLYETSRRLQTGEKATLTGALFAWRRHGGQIALMGLVLMLFHLAWVRVATLLFALFFDEGAIAFPQLIELLFFSTRGLPFVIVGAVIGAALATLVFALSAVSIPMLLDRDVDVITAMVTSFVAVRQNARPMALWAGLIALFTVFGLGFFLVGLAVALPLLGHATWHAYKEMVE